MTPENVNYPVGYLTNLPGGLRRAFASGRWLPIIGAGLSATATTSDRRSPPTWSGLRDKLSLDLPSTAAVSPIDTISAFADTYGRASLIERLNEVLLVDSIEPSEVHRAFAQLPFDMVVTTNVDFLLEQAYAQQRRPCVPLIGEAQLSIQRRPEATNLLKFHGDLRHPDNLVMTEDDYDGFIRRNPLLATYLSWWLLTREPIFIGYSLDDADLREVLVLLRERLGRMSRPSWVILATDPHNEARKFERRGVRPIVLHSNPRADRATIFSRFFDELREEWERSVVNQIEASTDASTAELVRDYKIAPQLALFVADDSSLALFREFIFPSISDTGYLPAGIDEIRTQDRATKPMAIDVALTKAAVVIYDLSRRNPIAWEYVTSRRKGAPAVVINRSPDSQSDISDGYPVLSSVESVDDGTWQHQLLEPLLDKLRPLKHSPSSDSMLSHNLTLLSEQMNAPRGEGEDEVSVQDRLYSSSKQLLLSCLAILESQLRREGGISPAARPKRGNASRSRAPANADEAPSPEVDSSSTGGRMSRMQDYFGVDFNVVMRAIQLRHTILQQLDVSLVDISNSAREIHAVVKKRLPRFTQG